MHEPWAGMERGYKSIDQFIHGSGVWRKLWLIGLTIPPCRSGSEKWMISMKYSISKQWDTSTLIWIAATVWYSETICTFSCKLHP